MKPSLSYRWVAFQLGIVSAICVAGGLLAGCQSPSLQLDKQLVEHDVLRRISSSAPTTSPATMGSTDPSAMWMDGMSEDKAVLTALINNASFQAVVAQLGMAEGDVVQAGLLANPQVLIYFPVGDKQGQYTLYAPIESYLLRPRREQIAHREYHRIGRQLVHNGLTLVRDVRVAYTDLALAVEQLRLSEEAVELREELSRLTEKRLKEGDISNLEATAARVEAWNAKATAGVQREAVNIARSRLVALLGISWKTESLTPEPLERDRLPDCTEEQLVDDALLYRTDLHAAKCAVAAARDRSLVSRWTFLRLDGVVDVRSNANAATQVGPGLRFDLPVFNRNQGGVLRASAEVAAAEHNCDALRDLIVQEVRTAMAQLRQTNESLNILNDEVLPALETALATARRGYSDGGIDYLMVLQTASQYLAAKSRMLDQMATYRRAAADLERAVGHPVTSYDSSLVETSVVNADVGGKVQSP